MSAQREGLFSDIVDKFKDLIDNEDENKDADKSRKQDPPLTPQCCGPTPPGWPIVGDPNASVEHDANCPNHPDNVATAEVAS